IGDTIHRKDGPRDQYSAIALLASAARDDCLHHHDWSGAALLCLRRAGAMAPRSREERLVFSPLCLRGYRDTA
ncbi:MAG: hypothetical protein ACM3ZE_09200, partial [Myxococcales bacterium]